MKRPWWGYFCIVGPDVVFWPYLFSACILFPIAVFTQLTPVFRVTTVFAATLAVFAISRLKKLSSDARFVIYIKRPFVLLSIKGDQIKSKHAYHEGWYWRWNPRFNNIVIKYGEIRTKASSKTAIKSQDKNGVIAHVVCSATIRVNPSLEQAIKIYDTCGDENWPEVLKKWFEEQISQFGADLEFEDYSEVEAKIKQFGVHDENAIAELTDFTWGRQFEGLDQELRDYLNSRLETDWPEHHLWLEITSIDNFSFNYN